MACAYVHVVDEDDKNKDVRAHDLTSEIEMAMVEWMRAVDLCLNEGGGARGGYHGRGAQRGDSVSDGRAP